MHPRVHAGHVMSRRPLTLVRRAVVSEPALYVEAGIGAEVEHGAHLQHSRAAQPAVSCSCVWRAEWSTGVELSATTISFACELLHSASPSSVACLMRPAERKAPQGHSNIQVRQMRGWPACLPYRRRLPRSRKAEPSTLTILFARRCSNETGPKSWQIDVCGSGNDDDMRPAAFVALRSISGEGPT
jgi:hypothetical protein